MNKRPYIHFYKGDWLRDPSLSLCSPATRGIWIDLLCALDEMGGTLTAPVESLARMVRATSDETRAALSELSATKSADVTFGNGNVTVTSRRLQREAKDRELTRLRVNRARRNADVTHHVTPMLHPLSLSVSLSDTDRDREKGAGESDETRTETSSSVVIPPMSRAQFDTICEMRAVPKECSEWIWTTYDARGWVDTHGQPIRKVEPLIMRHKASWRDCVPSQQAATTRNATQPTKQTSVWETTKRMEAIEAEMTDLKVKGGMEAAFGFEWTDQKRRAHWAELKRTRDELRRKLTKVNGH